MPVAYGAEVGQHVCDLCPAGKFTPDSGNTACRNCTEGYLCVEGSSAPQPCPGGTHADQSVLAAVGFLSNLATELGLSDLESDPMELFMDNRSGIDVAYNPEHHTKMKHVARRHFYVRDMVEARELVVPFVRTDDNPADFFTKRCRPRSSRPCAACS